MGRWEDGLGEDGRAGRQLGRGGVRSAPAPLRLRSRVRRGTVETSCVVAVGRSPEGSRTATIHTSKGARDKRRVQG
jgi:hypothetical protein